MTPLFEIVYEGTWFSVNRLPRSGTRKTDTYEVLTKDCEFIGHIAWYGRWRTYAYFPEPESVMEAQCMREIAAFLVQSTRLTRQQLASTRAQRTDPGAGPPPPQREEA